MNVSIIAALSTNLVIGRAGGLPWRLPADLRRFKAMTTGHAVIMGRRTFDSLPAPLANRLNIVVSRGLAAGADGRVVVARSLAEALTLAAGREGVVYVAGGAEIYAVALPVADRLDLTIVHATVEGDTFFPPVAPSAWRLAEDERHPPDDRHPHAYSFRTYLRVGVTRVTAPSGEAGPAEPAR